MTYLLNASLAIAIFYALYGILFRRLPFHALNRVYMLAALGASLLIPLLELPAPAAALTQPVQTVFYVEDPEPFPETTFIAPAEPEPVDWWAMAWYAYLAGAGLMTLRLGRSLWRLSRLLNQPGQRLGSLTVIPTSGQNASFFHWILLNDTGLSDAERRQVLAHEAEHTRLGHSADRFLLEGLRVVFWFNPVLWLVQRSLAHLHELEVDARMARRFEAQGYARLLLKLHGGLALPLTNLFSQQPLKDRIRALFQTKPTNSMKKLLYLSVLPLLAAVTLTLAQQAPPPPPPPPPPPSAPPPPATEISLGEKLRGVRNLTETAPGGAVSCWISPTENDVTGAVKNAKPYFKNAGFVIHVGDLKYDADNQLSEVELRLTDLKNGNNSSATYRMADLRKVNGWMLISANRKTRKTLITSKRVSPSASPTGERHGAVVPPDAEKLYGTKNNHLIIQQENGIQLLKTKAGALVCFQIETPKIRRATTGKFKAELTKLGYEVNLVGLISDVDQKPALSASIRSLKTGQSVKKLIDLTSQRTYKKEAKKWSVIGVMFFVGEGGNLSIHPMFDSPERAESKALAALPPPTRLGKNGALEVWDEFMNLAIPVTQATEAFIKPFRPYFEKKGFEIRVVQEKGNQRVGIRNRSVSGPWDETTVVLKQPQKGEYSNTMRLTLQANWVTGKAKTFVRVESPSKSGAPVPVKLSKTRADVSPVGFPNEKQQTSTGSASIPTEQPGKLILANGQATMHLNLNRYDPEFIETAKRFFQSNGAELKIENERIDAFGKWFSGEISLHTKGGSTAIWRVDAKDARQGLQPWIHMECTPNGVVVGPMQVPPVSANGASSKIQASFLPTFWPFKKPDGC